MNKSELLNDIARNSSFKDYCFRLCRSDLANDLHQEFLLYLSEQTEDFILEKYNNIQLIGFCYSVIKFKYLDFLKTKKYAFTNNTLSNGNFISLSDLQADFIDDNYNYEIDVKFEKTIKYLESDKSIKKYHAALLFNSVDKSTREISEMIGTKQRVVIYQINKIKDKIKANVK